ncbi:hypothetical protein HN695_02750 [Candidatus Woesearchaeota archaeon]|jgi:hypothetical protein|nr:hypothetical protein [Candidatus Woesearchaeota archaeon]MBT5272110.1 hypothetical protein [Candidatus Woesearchaeota archaeon]MBT6040913.1 hypothetical protein [Candidatus Woesearchaeota archaeon]MBT6336247.1 hypothetical protein [Candidatus Woesearchaeota archaeon]MBT7927230.1 hypothetical protein [Candidatus Woesearchaeota archaeon]
MSRDLIKDSLEVISREVAMYRSTGSSSHVLPMFKFLEDELYGSKRYRKIVPEGFPSNMVEEKGFRRLEKPSESEYLGVQIRLGITTTHLREHIGNENLRGIVMVLTSERDYIELPSPAKATLASDFGLVLMLETGAISALYANMQQTDQTLMTSWCPSEKSGFAKHPFPTEPRDITQTLWKQNPNAIIDESKVVEAMPYVIMMAVKAYNHWNRPKNKVIYLPPATSK